MVKARTLPRFVWAVALGLGPIPSVAQRTTFDPQVALGIRYTDNVAFVGEEDASDSVLRFALTLPVVRQTKKSSFSFTYSPYIVRHQDFGELDHDGHRLSLGLAHQPSPRSSLEVNASYARTQEQGDPESLDDADLFAARRTDRERASLDLAFRSQLRRRWTWSGSVGFSEWQFDEISGFEGEEPLTDLEDRMGLTGSVELSREFSRRASVGVR